MGEGISFSTKHSTPIFLFAFLAIEYVLYATPCRPILLLLVSKRQHGFGTVSQQW